MTASPRRAVVAAGLLAALLAGLLGAWFASGWADVRGRQRAVRDAPRLDAEQRGAELAHELRGELAAVIAREVERPYFHYQNLFHDPRASAVSVAPSPLAQGSPEPLVLGYFQLDARARATTPTINDDLPELSEPTRLADHRRFRDEVTRSLAGELAPRATGPLVASLAAPPPAERSPAPRPTAQRPPPRPQPAAPASGEAQGQALQAQVVTLDPSSYAQNNTSNSLYVQQRNMPPLDAASAAGERRTTAGQPAAGTSTTGRSTAGTGGPTAGTSTTGRSTAGTGGPTAGQPAAGTSTTGTSATGTSATGVRVAGTAGTGGPTAGQSAAGASAAGTSITGSPTAGAPAAAAGPAAAPLQRTVPRRAAESAAADRGREPSRPVTITVSPLEWRTVRFAGQPSLVAVRQVETPDGRLAQGFVVDRSSLTGWLATHAGDAIAELRAGDGGTTEIAPGWHLEVAPNPRAIAAAAVSATSLARGFVARFVAIGVVAILAALLVVMLVVRAERLARERSQFAAAAAHELRTPLAGLQLYGDMLADGLGDPTKLRDYARRMSEEASRLGRVVSNVLGFSQLERGNLSVDARVAALDDALHELAERARPALDRAGAALALDVASELAARFDRDAVARIVGNLLDNAEKYSRGAADRTIALAARAAGDTVEIAVSDHGPGVPARARARLFRPFARGVDGDGPAGLGLGLALSQSLARAMGGELAYRPAPGGGATFVLTLPRA